MSLHCKSMKTEKIFKKIDKNDYLYLKQKNMTKKTFSKLLFFKLPIAWVAGVKLKEFSSSQAITGVKLTRWSQNPFKSMFWAVQGMAAELSTGILCIDKIRKSKHKVSMLVIEQKAVFTKKAVGEISFTCTQGAMIDEVLKKAIETGEGQTIELISKGIDEKGEQVSEFTFLWSFKLKS